MLTACYDLALSPPTYDFIGFLLTAEIKRLQANQDSVQIVILPGPVGGFRSDNLWPRSNTKRKELLQSIVLPMCKLLPSCTAAELATDRNTRLSEPVIGRGARLYGMDKLVNALTNSRPLRPKVEPIKNDRLVTITLRECEHWPERNSNLSEWANAARAIRDMGYEIQFIRDTTHADESIDDFWINFEAARDLLVRASLYRSTFCNFFVNNGPAWLALRTQCTDGHAETKYGKIRAMLFSQLPE